MEQFVVSVASCCAIRLRQFISSIANTVSLDKIFLVILDTSQNSINVDFLRSYEPSLRYKVVCYPAVQRLKYAEIMCMKLDAARPYCNEASIYWNFDDDYVMNPYWYLVALSLFDDYPEINYLTLLKQYSGKEIVLDAGGFDLVKIHSSLGGGFGARWGEFYPLCMEYFEIHYVYNMWDQEFWRLLESKTGEHRNIYMSSHFSLIQHCNLVSNYLDEKRSKVDHFYGFDFDPCVNPFKVTDFEIN